MMFFGKLSRRRIVVPEREESLHNPSFLPVPAIITIISSANSECANKPPPTVGVRPISRLFNFKTPKLLQTQVSAHFRKKSRLSSCHKINNQLQTQDIHNITVPPVSRAQSCTVSPDLATSYSPVPPIPNIETQPVSNTGPSQTHPEADPSHSLGQLAFNSEFPPSSTKRILKIRSNSASLYSVGSSAKSKVPINRPLRSSSVGSLPSLSALKVRNPDVTESRLPYFLGRHPPPAQRRSVSLPQIPENRSSLCTRNQEVFFLGGQNNQPRIGYYKVPQFVPIEIRLNATAKMFDENRICCHFREDCSICVQCFHGFYKCKECGRDNSSMHTQPSTKLPQTAYTGVPNPNNDGSARGAGANSGGNDAMLEGTSKTLAWLQSLQHPLDKPK